MINHMNIWRHSVATGSKLNSSFASRHSKKLYLRKLSGFPGVDGQYPESQAEASKAFAQDLNKNSKLRAILLSVDVLIGGTELVPKVKVIAEHVDSNPGTGAVKVAPTYDKSKEIQGVTDVKTKYMQKLNKKMQGGERVLGMGVNPDRGDAAILKVGRKIAHEDDAARANSGGAWMLASGMGGLLDYCQHRTLHIGK